MSNKIQGFVILNLNTDENSFMVNTLRFTGNTTSNNTNQNTFTANNISVLNTSNVNFTSTTTNINTTALTINEQILEINSLTSSTIIEQINLNPLNTALTESETLVFQPANLTPVEFSLTPVSLNNNSITASTTQELIVNILESNSTLQTVTINKNAKNSQTEQID